MKLEVTDIEGNPYQFFLSCIKDSETKRQYAANLKEFLDLIPDEIFAHYATKLKDRTTEEMAALFVQIAKKETTIAKNIIRAYVTHLKNNIEKPTTHSDYISPGTAKNKLKPIKKLLRANDIDISWYLVDRAMPNVGKSQDRAYTREEIKSMMAKVTDLTDKVIITMFSSGMFRVEAWNYFTWNDVVFFPNKDEGYNGAALCVYRGDIEEYWTFITPEACSYLKLYKEEFKKRFMRYPEPNDPLLVSTRYDKPVRLRDSGVKKRVENFVSAVGLRPELPPGKKRHDVMLAHGFRKYASTMCRRAKVNFADKEDLMGHKIALESHYERYVENDFERFSEYKKAIPFLTISDEQRQRLELQKQKEENTELEKKNRQIMELTQKQQENEARYHYKFRQVEEQLDDMKQLLQDQRTEKLKKYRKDRL